MGSFPKGQDEVAALAGTMIDGLTAHGEDFPSLDAGAIASALTAYKQAREAQLKAAGQAKVATAECVAKLATLKRVVKGQLKQAAVDTDGHPARLAEIGWSPPSSPRPLTPPNQPKDLRLRNRPGVGLMLTWAKPPTTAHNAPANYRVMWRLAGGPMPSTGQGLGSVDAGIGNDRLPTVTDGRIVADQHRSGQNRSRSGNGQPHSGQGQSRGDNGQPHSGHDRPRSGNGNGLPRPAGTSDQRAGLTPPPAAHAATLRQGSSPATQAATINGKRSATGHIAMVSPPTSTALATDHWQLADAVATCELSLASQPPGVRYEYQVVATNPSGNSGPSNVVTVIV